jgi:hypothetical protein
MLGRSLERQPSLGSGAASGQFSRLASRYGEQLWQPDQIVGGHREGELKVYAREATHLQDISRRRGRTQHLPLQRRLAEG